MAFVRTRPAAENRAEAPLTLDEPAPRALSLFDQLGLWGNLGVSLLGFTGAIVVLRPEGPGGAQMSLPAALLAILVGSALGAAAIAAAAVPGAQTGAPAMVLLRGLFGARVSAVPTVLNIVQMVGWGTFELVTIAAALGQVFPAVPNSAWVLGCGAVTTVLAVHPLGSVRVLRRYVSVAVVLALGYLFVQLLREPVPATAAGGWSGFGRGVDTTLAVAISWVPMAADYARHSRTPRAAAGGAFLGYAVTQVACYALGVVALVTAATGGSAVFAAFLAVPLGAVAFLVLAVRELDQSFADVYSTTISTQNLRPGWDRRVISLVVGAITTLLALVVNIYDYASFLSVIGSVFVPMFAVLVVDWFGFAGPRRWNLGPDARSRPAMLLPWAAGFATYQLLNPGQVPGWSSTWASLATTLGIAPPAWLSASLCAFAAAAACTGLVHAVTRRPPRR